MTTQTTYPTTFCGPGEGVELYSVDAEVTVKCRAAQTGGGFEVFEVDMPRGADVPPHTEPWPKAFYVLSGRMAVRSGDETYELGPGGFVTVPPRAANTFRVLTPAVKFLAFSLGEGMGNFFADVDRTAPRGASLQELMPLMQDVVTRNDVQFVDEAVSA